MGGRRYPKDVQYFNATGKALVLWRQQSVSLYWAARYLVDEKPGLNDEDRREENAPAALMLGGYGTSVYPVDQDRRPMK
jgi:hypothetical protein